MTNLEIIRAVVTALEAGDVTELGHFVSDDFYWKSTNGDAKLNMQAVVSVHGLLLQGFPDWQFNMRGIEKMPDRFRVHFQATGTHTGTLDIQQVGLGVYPPTGRFVIQPAESFDFWMENSRVTKMILNADPAGGFPGIVRQLSPENRQYWKNLIGKEHAEASHEN